MIYRQRNLIVHNAHYNKIIVLFSILKAERYANDLIRLLLEDYILNFNTSAEAIISRKIKIDRLLNKLKNNQPVNIWAC